MKKIKYSSKHCILLVFMAVTSFFMFSCKTDVLMSPVITSVRNYAASPNDTIVTSVNPGQFIVLEGSNLSSVSAVTFCGVPATINSALFSDDKLVVKIPTIRYDSVPVQDLNKIVAISEGGIATYTIDIIGAPLITRLRNFADSPNDTILTSIVPGQKINIIGFNLKNPTGISFQGVVADLSVIEYTDSSAIVQVPADLAGGVATLVNTISYTSSIGSGLFGIKIFGPPVVLSVSYEIPQLGDTVYLYGSSLSSIQSLTFAGADITTFVESPDGSTIMFIAPTLTQKGPVVIEAPGGTFTSAYNVNDILTGIISDFEWGDNFHWDWWGGAELKSGWPSGLADFPGNLTQFLTLKDNVLESAKSGNQIRISNVQLLPAADLSISPSNLALKFEMTIPKDWNGSSMCITTANESFMVRLEPWQISASRTAAYRTKGWQTVTIPLSLFRTKSATLGDGRGTYVETLTALFGPTGKSNLILYLHNYGSADTKTGFLGAFDNFRIVNR